MSGVRTWLVSGGVGFIGHHVVRALARRGDRVRVLDDFSDAPYPTRLKRENAAELTRESSDVEIVEGSVTDAAVVERVTKGVTGVIHLAGLAGVRPSFAEPAHYQRVNVEGTATMLDAAQRAGIDLFAVASSIVALPSTLTRWE